jgi:ketosteroid isomerase-like protein
MAERSQEVEQALRELIEAMGRSDLDTVGQRMSQDSDVLSIGSDPDEWVEGYEENMRLLRASTPEGELGVTVGIDDVKGFVEGTVAWAASRGYFEREGARIPVRFTAVLRQEDGEWKVVQAHASIGVPNDRMGDSMFQSG